VAPGVRAEEAARQPPAAPSAGYPTGCPLLLGARALGDVPELVAARAALRGTPEPPAR